MASIWLQGTNRQDLFQCRSPLARKPESSTCSLKHFESETKCLAFWYLLPLLHQHRASTFRREERQCGGLTCGDLSIPASSLEGSGRSDSDSLDQVGTERGWVEWPCLGRLKMSKAPGDSSRSQCPVGWSPRPHSISSRLVLGP